MKAEAARRGGFIEINFGLEVPAAAVRRRRKYDTARGRSMRGKPAVSRKLESQTRWPP